jgi:hypothetical protein
MKEVAGVIATPQALQDDAGFTTLSYLTLSSVITNLSAARPKGSRTFSGFEAARAGTKTVEPAAFGAVDPSGLLVLGAIVEVSDLGLGPVAVEQ